MKTSSTSLALALVGASWLIGPATAHAAPPASSGPREIARVTGAAPGNHVLFLENDQGEVDVAVAAIYPQRPLIAPRFLKSHSAAEVFLAVAPANQELPAALARHARLAVDRGTREQLQRENADALASVTSDVASGGQSLTASCSESFRDWVSNVYGDATCGDPSQEAIYTAHPSDTYCTSGCDYTLGAQDKGTCQPKLRSCDIVRGTASVVRLRTTNWWNGPNFNHPGHFAHFGVANCTGNGPVDFNYKRGAASTSTLQVPVNGMLHVKLGSEIVPGNAANFVSYGQWKTGKPASGATYVSNSMSVEANGGTDDRVIACGDIYLDYTMADISSPTCHGSDISLCSGGNCTSSCFYCSGGSCPIN
ncbi:hypothetical protein D7Y13_04570 [Corallococcus praedator]|uniref:Secreted protein n=1 Tax=Corallococcus praedator TaxID=2316724 RepID=A0ABX9QRG3_9BACT|nr:MULTISPECIES: hypothetical protein [Corallococcus]RKH36030.1 hypothetical protein D7X75_02170 [Corallococcus sp. CA031C]RKI15248.1 hypothetical protein D7Y13_04570 [Corallococcus praedator]